MECENAKQINYKSHGIKLMTLEHYCDTLKLYTHPTLSAQNSELRTQSSELRANSQSSSHKYIIHNFTSTEGMMNLSEIGFLFYVPLLLLPSLLTSSSSTFFFLFYFFWQERWRMIQVLDWSTHSWSINFNGFAVVLCKEWWIPIVHFYFICIWYCSSQINPKMAHENVKNIYLFEAL